MSVAARWDLYDEDVDDVDTVSFAPTAAAGSPATFPSTPLVFLVELLLNGVWVDITDYVMCDGGLTITRGRRDEQTQTAPSRAVLRLRNVDRRFSPRNVTGPYYPYLTRNVKVRISVNPGSGMSTRFTGFVSQWPPRWSVETDRSVRIEADGVLRRLGRSQAPLRSAPRRFFAEHTTNLVAYWPLEAGAFADNPGLPDVGAYAMRPVTGFHPSGALIGFPQWGSGTLAPWLPPVLSRSGTAGLTAIWAPVEMNFNTSWTVGFGYASGTDPGADTVDGIAATVDVNPSYLGGAAGWPQLQMLPSTQEIATVLNGEPETVVSAGNLYDGLPHYVSWTVSQFAGFGLSEVWIDDVQYLSQVTSGAMTVEGIRQLGLLATAQTGSGIAQGHVSVHTPGFLSPVVFEAILGHRGELATDRFARLCLEEGVSSTISELLVDSEQMGPQASDTLLNLLRECEAVNEGVIDEDRQGRLRFGSRTVRWNQQPAIILNYTTQVAARPGLEPTDDDFALRNDWTINRRGGGEARAQQLDGPLSVLDPPNGVGAYRDQATLNVDSDSQASMHAAYRLAKGTVDEQRFIQIPFSLTANPELIPQWLSCDIGSRLVIEHGDFSTSEIAKEVGPDRVDQVIEGYVEVLDSVDWRVVAFTSPNALNRVGVYGVARYDCNGSTLAEDLDTTETGIDLTITDQCVWAHDNGDYSVTVGGEEMTVTAVSAAAGTYPAARTQTLTVTRSVNGVVKPHTAGAEVHLKVQARYAL